MKVIFNIPRFLKFFIYHLLFFFMGPFCCIPIGLIDGFILPHNMAFIGFGTTFWGQMLPTAYGLIGLYFWIFLSNGTVGAVEIALLEFSIVLRSLVIAIKYGFLPDDIIHGLKTRTQKDSEKQKQQIVYSWLNTTPEGRNRGIEDCFT